MIRLQNVANLNLLYKVLIQTPYINISRTFIHRPNSSLQFPELKVSLLENNFDVLKNNKSIIKNDTELKIRVEILKDRIVELIENL